MSYPIKEILGRVGSWWTDRDFTKADWKDPHEDAAALGILVQRLVKQVHELNDKQAEPQDLCRVCGDFKWGRPQLSGGGQDMSKRKCHDCGEVRAEWHVVSGRFQRKEPSEDT